MDTISKRANAFSTGFFRSYVVGPVVRGTEFLLLWRRRAKERHAMAHLDDTILRDLGLSRSEITWESRKPFWRA